MVKRNLTVQLDDDVIRQAKVLAAKRGTSVSTLVAVELERLVADDERYEDARRRARRALAGRHRGAGGAGGATSSASGDRRPELTFVDTNVLAYAHDASEEERQPITAALLEELWRTRAGIVSTHGVLRGGGPHVRPAPSSAREIIDAYAAWPVVHVDASLILAASALEERHRLSFSDALIVEAVRRGGARRLVSDLQAGRRIAGLVIDNPFPPRRRRR